MDEARDVPLLGADGQRMSREREAECYETHLGSNGKKLARYLVSDTFVIGDILSACGLPGTDAGGRSAVKRLVTDAGVLSLQAGRGRRRFTGHDVLLVALLYELRRLALPLDYMPDVYRSQAKHARKELRLDTATVEACLEDRRMGAAWWVAEFLRIRYPIVFGWVQADVRLQGAFLPSGFPGPPSIWGVGSSGARVGDPDAPAVVVRISPLMKDIAARIPAVPPIPATFCEPASLKRLDVSAPERALIEAIRSAPKAFRFRVETDGRGNIREVRYWEEGSGRRTGATALLQDPTTHAVQSVKGSDGRIARIDREVLLKF